MDFNLSKINTLVNCQFVITYYLNKVVGKHSRLALWVFSPPPPSWHLGDLGDDLADPETQFVAQLGGIIKFDQDFR